MTRHSIASAIAALLAIAACDTAPPPPAAATMRAAPPRASTSDSSPSAPWVVFMRGMNSLESGTAQSEIPATMGIAPVAAGTAPPPCRMVRATRGARAGAIAFMLVRDTIARIDVDSSSIPTAWGDHVGDLEAEVLRRHAGHVRTEPHKYTGPVGHYLIVTDSTDAAHMMVFETDGQHVTRYRAGRRPEVEWVEGCA